MRWRISAKPLRPYFPSIRDPISGRFTLKPHELIATARKLIHAEPDAPSDTDIRRAISSAYYALFHTVAQASASFLVPDPDTTAETEAWHLAYRALDHRTLKNACLNKAVSRGPTGISTFADVLQRMQSKRHVADYHPTAVFSSSEVSESIDECDAAIIAFETSSETDRRTFVAFALFRSR